MYGPSEIKLLTRIPIEGTVTLGKVVFSFAKTNPEEYARLSKSLYQEPHGDRYISHYGRFGAVFSYDVFATIAIIRVMIDDNFNKTYLDVVGEFTKKFDQR